MFFYGDDRYRFKAASRRLKKLYDNKLLNRNRCFKGGQFIYWLSNSSIEYLKQNGIKTYNCIREITIERWNHDELVQKVLLGFTNMGFTRYFSDRQLLSNPKISISIVPDLGIYINDDYLLAVEIEIHQKSTNRIQKKLTILNRTKLFDGVLYITKNNAISEKVISCYKSLTAPSFYLITVDMQIFISEPARVFSHLNEISKAKNKGRKDE